MSNTCIFVLYRNDETGKIRVLLEILYFTRLRNSTAIRDQIFPVFLKAPRHGSQWRSPKPETRVDRKKLSNRA